jgi:hypothetical protein
MNFKDKKFLSQAIPVFAFILAFICSFFLAGASLSETTEAYGQTIEVTAKINLISFIFGGGSLETTTMGVNVSLSKDGGLSYFALLSFLIGLGSTISFVYDIVKKESKFTEGADILMAIAGILMLFVLVAGTKVSVSMAGISESETFRQCFDGFSIGIGAIVWTVLCLGGGIASFILQSKAK